MATGNWKRLGSGKLLTEDADQGLGHIVPIKSYTLNLLALLGLTVLTVYVATLDFGMFNMAIAVGIALVKVTLVASIFMHLKWEKKIIFVVATYPVIILVLLFLGTVGDAAIIRNATPLNIEPAVPAWAAPVSAEKAEAH